VSQGTSANRDLNELLGIAKGRNGSPISPTVKQSRLVFSARSDLAAVRFVPRCRAAVHRWFSSTGRAVARQSPIRIKATRIGHNIARCREPLAGDAGPRKPSVPRRVHRRRPQHAIAQLLGFAWAIQPVMAHDAGTTFLQSGRFGGGAQSTPWFCQPVSHAATAVPLIVTLSSERSRGVELHTVSHHMKASACELVCDRLDGHHRKCLAALALIKALDGRIVADREVSGFYEGPA
jgi:hypothetical protein